MDFSSPSRALESLTRRRPALPNDVLKCAQLLIDNNKKDENQSDTTNGQEAEENVRNITFLKIPTIIFYLFFSKFSKVDRFNLFP